MLLLLVHGCYSKERKVVRGWRWRCSKRWRERSSCWEPENPPLFLLLSLLLPSFLKKSPPSLFSLLCSISLISPFLFCFSSLLFCLCFLFLSPFSRLASLSVTALPLFLDDDGAVGGGWEERWRRWWRCNGGSSPPSSILLFHSPFSLLFLFLLFCPSSSPLK